MGVIVASISAWPSAAHTVAAHARTSNSAEVNPANATELLTLAAQAEWQTAVEYTTAVSSKQHRFHWPSPSDTVAYDSAVIQWDRLQSETDNAIKTEALKHDAYKRTLRLDPTPQVHVSLLQHTPAMNGKRKRRRKSGEHSHIIPKLAQESGREGPLTALEQGLTKSRSDCVDGDGASSDNGMDQFNSPPQSPAASSSYSPYPSPLRDEDVESQRGSAALRAVAVDLLLNGPPSQLNVSTDTPAERVTGVSNAASSHTPAADHHEARITAIAEALYVTVQSQRGSDGSVIINLEEVPPTADAPDVHNNLVTLSQAASDHPDSETLRMYQQVVVAVRGGLSQHTYELEATSLLRRIHRSAPRASTFQTIRAVINLFHGGWDSKRARRNSSSLSNFKIWKKKLRPFALALMSTPGALPKNDDLQLHDGPLADDTVVLMGELVTVASQASDSEDEDESRPAGWKQWWASDAHHKREQERTDRVVKVSSDAYAVLADSLPASCPTFEQVMHFVEWTLLNNAHGGLMDFDSHLHERVMGEFLGRGTEKLTTSIPRRARTRAARWA